jgi:hypothetical protein
MSFVNAWFGIRLVGYILYYHNFRNAMLRGPCSTYVEYKEERQSIIINSKMS